MKKLLFLTLPLLTAAAVPPGCEELFEPHPIVYTSQPIDKRPWDSFGTMSALQPASEVARITQGFGETDLEIKNVDGSVKVIYNCTASPVVCAAQEPRINPAGTKVAFSVSFGNSVDAATLLVNEFLYAKLYLYDVATGTVTQIPNQDNTTHNRMPDWLNDDTIVYASNKGILQPNGTYQSVYPVKDQWNCHGGTYPDGRKRGYDNGNCISQTFGTGQASRSMQIWKMRVDGTQQVNLTPHEFNAIRPTVFRSLKNQGRIIYSAWWGSNEDLGFYQASAGPGTMANLWRLVTMDGNGADSRVFLGAHHSGVINKEAPPGFQQVTEIMANRAFMDNGVGQICGVNYYRGNHGGLGDAWCASTADFTVEGCSTQSCYTRSVYPSDAPGSGQYMPPDYRLIAPFSVGSDNEQNVDSQGRATGTFGGLFHMANSHIAGTWGKGWCYNQQSDRGFTPLTCDKNIAELLVDHVTDPFDPAQLHVLVGDPNKHETDAAEVHAHVVPPQTAPLDQSKGCFLDVVNMRLAELIPRDPTFHWNLRAELVGIQANTVNPYKPETYPNRIKSLTFLGVKNWSVDSRDPKFKARVDYMGYEDVWVLGTQAMMADGSLRAQVPCEQPLLMSGTDAQGRTIAHDPMLLSLRKGETRTCRGCHEGHSVERAATYTETADAAFSATQAAFTNPPLLNGTKRVAFADVAPIITKACSGCHTGFQNDSLLWSRVFADQEQLDFPWMKKMLNANGTQWLPRPYFSGLVARYADWSMLVWVMQGKRSDGFANSDYPDDQDYPANHPAVPVTAAEIQKVVDFIQLGAPRG